MRKMLVIAVSLILVLFVSKTTCLASDDDILDLLPAILAGAKREPPPPPGVTVLPTQSYQEDYSGELQIVGEIYNNTTSNIEYVKIVANVFNGTSFVATGYTSTQRDIIPPKTKSCFLIWTDYPGPYSRVDFEPIDYDNTSDRLPALSLKHVSSGPDHFGDIEVLGFVNNNDTKTVEYSKIIGTFYNSNGKVIECDYAYTSIVTLAPGQSSSFKINTNTSASQVANYILQTDGDLP